LIIVDCILGGLVLVNSSLALFFVIFIKGFWHIHSIKYQTILKEKHKIIDVPIISIIESDWPECDFSTHSGMLKPFKKGTSMILCFYRQALANFKEKHRRPLFITFHHI